jgi:predicted permease
VEAWEHNVSRGIQSNVVSVPMYEAWRDRSRTLSQAAALVPDYQTLSGATVERIGGAAVTASWFDVVGVAPALGRGFTEGEAVANDVVVLSSGLWRERFNSDAGVIGRRLVMSGEPRTVVGVMPAGFEPPSYGWLGAEQAYWVPFTPDENNRTWGRSLLVLGRLAPGANVEAAGAELRSIVRDREATGPALAEWSARVLPLREEITGDMRTPLLALGVAVGCLLLLGVVNVTNLLLVRVDRRSAEFGIRAAVGAGRGRLARQLAAEALVIVGLTAPAGLVLGWAGLRVLMALMPADLPRAGSVHLGVSALILTAVIALAAGVVLAVTPLLRLRRAPLYEGLRAGAAGRSRAGGRGLVIAEVALALVLTVGAGLTLRSFIALRSVPLGIDVANVTAFRVSLPGDAYGSAEAKDAFYDRLLARIAATSGVESAAAINVRPLATGGTATSVGRLGDPWTDALPVAVIRHVTSGYFATLGIRTIRGVGLDPGGGGRDVVVNRTLAADFWPEANPVGEHIVVALNGGDTMRVAGVVEDVRLAGPTTELRPTVYYPYRVTAPGAMDVVARSVLPAEAMASLVRAAVAELDPSLPVTDVERLDYVLEQMTARERVETTVLTAFAALAMLLAATGIYGVLAMEVAKRRREIGIRVALGAAPGAISARVVASALGIAGAGLVIGLGAALILTRFMSSMLFAVSAVDARTYAVVTGLLLGVTLLAAWPPARRAARADPMASLRGE